MIDQDLISSDGTRRGNRQPHVKRKNSVCHIHGTTTFAQYGTGLTNTAWYCMACQSEKAKKYYAANGNKPKTPRVQKTEVKRPTCESCHMELPATKICDTCD